MNQRARIPGDRLPLLITVGVFVAMLACLPLVRMLDADLDEDRPLFQDIARMQDYQVAHLANDGRPVEATVSDGQSVMVGSKEFVASPGVTVVVRATDTTSFCVSGSNDQGVTSQEHCSD